MPLVDVNDSVPDFNFSQHKIIRDFASTRGEDPTKKCLGLIAYGQEIFYIWESCKNELHTANVKQSLRDDVWDEETVLRLRMPPLFTVERLLLNSSCSLMALTGPEGVAVLHLPESWEKNKIIHVPCVSLGERVFQGERHLLRCAKWNPGSPSDSHLVTLTSDECLRCYNVLDKSVLWSCHLSKHSVISHLNIPSRIMLGDTPVNFDFVSPTLQPDEPLETAEWPILVLWGNGNIFYVVSTMTSKKPTITGPLLMSPASDDNYGSDASSLIVIRSSPPLVILSTCSGTIYHSLLLTSEEADNPDEKCLCVVEAIELDLGITVGDDIDMVSCPISLMGDPTELSRYFCIHAGGVHSITIPFTSKLYDFVEFNSTELPSCETNSIVDYLVCTAVSSSSYECSPLLGFAFVDLMMSMFVLLSSGKLVNARLLPKAMHSLQTLLTERTQNEEVGGIELMVENMLQDGGISNQPSTIDLPTNISAQNMLEIVLRTSQHFFNVKKTHEKVAFLLETRCATIETATKEQIAEIHRLRQKRSALKSNAETIAEKYEEMDELTTSISTRLQAAMNRLYSDGPELSQKERNALESLHSFQKKIERYDQDLKRLRLTQEYQLAEIKDAVAALTNTAGFYIGDAKGKALRKELSDFTKEVLSLKQQVEDVKEVLLNEGLIK
ncbi:Nuclear pore complex protein [Nesidiocoris tenuis]|uniref:Nuclear pore complex protein n=1 Tax=Nesidiocoris tenuis TaxID=355587 RepID=A0ABN7B0I6_9HEMI|nr:Nuclear pore complex protein [Nesidiocoris tenuis]